MHFMMIVTAHTESEVDLIQGESELADLLEFHDSMVRAGVVLSVEALEPWFRGVRVRYAADRPTIIDRPINKQRQHVVGFWLIRVKSMKEAIEWATRVPLARGEVEVRQTAFQLFPV